VSKREHAVTPSQRALWRFLLVTLVAPFLAALVVLLATAAGLLAGIGEAALLPPFKRAVFSAVSTYVWGAIPSAAAGAGLAACVAWRGTVPWLAAAIAGVVAFWLAAVLSGAVPPAYITPGALLAGAVGIACHGILARAGVLS
jgi:hypothetical protein